jgi:signal transduction histidine kinase
MFTEGVLRVSTCRTLHEVVLEPDGRLDLPDHVRHDVVTVVDELTSNALRHGEPPRQVRLLRRLNWLCVEVDDACLDPACSQPSMGSTPASGR